VAQNGCGQATSPGSSEQTIASGGHDRLYRLYVPDSYKRDQPAPVVLNFHGLGGNAKEQEQYSGFEDDADAAGFILVTPQALGVLPHWYVSGPYEIGYVDDVAFVSDLLDHLNETMCIDQQRLYAAGISNGGAMVALLACSLPGRFAAIAFVAGATYIDACAQLGPMPVLAFHGTDDRVVPFGGILFGKSIEDVMQEWANHNACSSGSSEQDVATDVALESYGGCSADVQLYVIKGGGHTWPGTRFPKVLLGATSESIDASAIIWDFFSRYG
jgi:polyhydroxybutyrate depolymerase